MRLSKRNGEERSGPRLSASSLFKPPSSNHYDGRLWAPSVVYWTTLLLIVIEAHLELAICSRAFVEAKFALHVSSQASLRSPVSSESARQLRLARTTVEETLESGDSASGARHLDPYFFLSRQKKPESLALSSSGERPKLIPLVAAESGYNENSSVNILCTVSSGHHESLLFDWFKDGQPIISTQEFSLDNPMMLASGNQHEKQQQSKLATTIQVDKHPDHSLLRISFVQASHAGRYTCSAKNQFGQDSSSVTLRVNVKLHWTREPPREMIVSTNQELKLDCLAHGEPKPLIRWERLQQTDLGSNQQKPTSGKISGAISAIFNPSGISSAGLGTGQTKPVGVQIMNAGGSVSSVLVSSGRYLTIGRARENDAGLYECIASNGNDADLRKIVHVQIRETRQYKPEAANL